MSFYICDNDDDYSDSFTKWDYLLQNTLILFTDPRVLKKIVPISKNWLISYEQKNNYILPEDYKNFLNTYGAGCFGNNDIRILMPGTDIEECCFLANQNLINYFALPNHDPKFDIVKSGYFFGIASGNISFIFDLNSYKNEDSSCDIYVLNLAIEPSITCLGRDFYYFIRELCLNNKIDEWLPEDFSLSHEDEEEDEDYEQQKDISELPGIFIPYWILPKSWG